MHQRQQDLGSVQMCQGLLQALLAGEKVLQVPSWAVLENQHEVTLCLEGVVKRYNVRMSNIGKDVSLRHCVAQQVAAQDPALLEHLHGVDLVCTFVPDLEDLAEGAAPQQAHELEGVGAHLLRLRTPAAHSREGLTHLRGLLSEGQSLRPARAGVWCTPPSSVWRAPTYCARWCPSPSCAGRAIAHAEAAGALRTQLRHQADGATRRRG
mmetsp:Transcript_69795/g.180013  ORF Transcript_69795/g.180013 Transcript_69795/m.180013 type:complete len:209 (+) Transcript_69795:1066-1692(+)